MDGISSVARFSLQKKKKSNSPTTLWISSQKGKQIFLFLSLMRFASNPQFQYARMCTVFSKYYLKNLWTQR